MFLWRRFLLLDPRASGFGRRRRRGVLGRRFGAIRVRRVGRWVALLGRHLLDRLFVNVQVFDVLPAEKQVGVHDVLGRDKGGRSRGVEELAAFGAVRADVFEGDCGVGFVDGVERAIVADVLLGDEGDATPCDGASERKGFARL